MNREPEDELLYHYTSFSTALEYILFNGTLKMGPMVRTNDPQEIDEWSPTIALTGDIKHFPLKEIMDSFNKRKNDAKLVCFSENKMPPEVPSYRIKTHTAPFNEKYYKGYNRPRMWSQYAENHKGICLGFNKEKLLEKIKETLESSGDIIAESVEYIEYSLKSFSPFSIDLKEYNSTGKDYIEKHQKEHLKSLFFEKAIDWRDESEFRILYIPHTPDDTNVELFINIEDCIEVIILGNYFPDVYIPSLLDLKKEKYPNVSIERMRYHNGKPYLNSQIHRRNSMN